MGGYLEDHFYMGIRIMLCVACCGFGMYAQFGTKFPKDRHILALCVAGYFLFSGVLAALDYWIISMSVMCIKVGDSSAFVDVNLPAFSHEVTISLRSGNRKVSHKDSVKNTLTRKAFCGLQTFSQTSRSSSASMS